MRSFSTENYKLHYFNSIDSLSIIDCRSLVNSVVIVLSFELIKILSEELFADICNRAEQEMPFSRSMSISGLVFNLPGDSATLPAEYFGRIHIQRDGQQKKSVK